MLFSLSESCVFVLFIIKLIYNWFFCALLLLNKFTNASWFDVKCFSKMEGTRTCTSSFDQCTCALSIFGWWIQGVLKLKVRRRKRKVGWLWGMFLWCFSPCKPWILCFANGKKNVFGFLIVPSKSRIGFNIIFFRISCCLSLFLR